MIKSSSIAALAEAFTGATKKPAVVVPTYKGRRGHPVCIARRLIPDFLGLPVNSQAREVIHRNVDSTCYIEVDDAGIVQDVDDPKAYQRLLKLDAHP